MDINKLKQVNEKILERVHEEIEKDLITKKTCDCTDMEMLVMGIKNIKMLEEIEEDIIKTDKVRVIPASKYEIKASETEFIKEINKLMEKKGKEEGHRVLFILLSEAMEDLKIMNSALYEALMRKIREIK